MQKLAEKLIEKHLHKMYVEECNKVFKNEFETVFKACCSMDSYKTRKNTTLGATFEILEEIATRNINQNIEILKDNTRIYEILQGKDSLRDIAYDLMDEFYYYLDVKNYVSSILSDEYWDKHKELQRSGIINEDGDFINEAIKAD